MNLYTLRGVESALVNGMVATRFVVKSFGNGIPPESTWLAKGTLWWKDYYTRQSGKDDWEAMLCFERTAKKERKALMLWQVHKKHDGLYCGFSMIPEINQGIARFIGHQLCFYGMHIAGDGRLPVMVRGPELFTRECKAYEGPCLCDDVRQSSVDKPFHWERATGGQYAQRCFQCSCGQRWWSVDPPWHRWMPVNDLSTWRMLLKYNGEPIRQLCIHEGAICLLGPMARRGYLVVYPPLSLSG